MPFIDFARLRQQLPIDSVASVLPVQWKQEKTQLRATCPVHGGDRGLIVTPEKNLFFCNAEGKGGDCIALYAHVHQCSNFDAAKALLQEFGLGEGTVPNGSVSKSRTIQATAPTEPEGRSQPAQKFDPESFAAKLVYSPEVAALKISEADAARVLIGWHPQRNAIFYGLRNPDGSISGFIKFHNGQLVMPPQWIAGNVVRLVPKCSA